jgi:hypothetical protein
VFERLSAQQPVTWETGEGTVAQYTAQPQAQLQWLEPGTRPTQLPEAKPPPTELGLAVRRWLQNLRLGQFWCTPCQPCLCAHPLHICGNRAGRLNCVSYREAHAGITSAALFPYGPEMQDLAGEPNTCSFHSLGSTAMRIGLTDSGDGSQIPQMRSWPIWEWPADSAGDYAVAC